MCAEGNSLLAACACEVCTRLISADAADNSNCIFGFLNLIAHCTKLAGINTLNSQRNKLDAADFNSIAHNIARFEL